MTFRRFNKVTKSRALLSRLSFGQAEPNTLSERLNLARRIAPVVNRVCLDRGLRLRFDSPGQIVITSEGKMRLVVQSQAQVYQVKNFLPTFKAEIEKALGEPISELSVSVNPQLHDRLEFVREETGAPRQSDPAAAARIREKAKTLPEGSVSRKTLESLADSLDC